MWRFASTLLAAALWLAPGAVAVSAESGNRPEGETLPADWAARWDRPPAEDRPLQIVHRIPPHRATPEGMQYYRDRGLGGIVCNVAFQEYMRSEPNWKTLVAGVEACDKLSLVVWLYDEDGYPSGAAGGLVLEENRQFEATELAYDPKRDDPFIIRPAYEHTHASNNYYAARRYANLLDDRATRSFLANTHDAYWQRLEPHFGRTIRATFTDEPSLIAINIGQIPADARKRVRVVDPIDPSVEPLPRVPWCYDLPERYRERYGEDLMPRRRSLFAGDSPDDRRVRRQFWALVADLVAERYFGAIQTWCSRHRVASSGHSLHEESIMHQVALEGNGLKVLGRMEIPGLDMLTSNPEAVIHSGWLTAGLPSSAAILNGTRRVMTEVSDFSQKMGGAGPVGLAEMQATAAWQAAWGVTEFTLYYGIGDRSAEDYRSYCDFVGRLNALVKPARFDRPVLLYYPIHDLWEEYLPVAEPLRLASQSARAQRIVGSFMRLGRTLQRSQIPFALVDHEKLAAAAVRPDGQLAIGDYAFEALVLPADVRVPAEAAEAVDALRRQGGRVLVDQPPEAPLTAESLKGKLQPAYRLLPPSERIVLGRFLRDGRQILLVLNVAQDAYRGRLTTDSPGAWLLLDPATGTMRRVTTGPSGHVELDLAARQTILLAQPR